MNHSKEAQEYWDTEGIRYLAEGNHVPSVEDRVKAAFDAGVKDFHRKNWFDAFNTNINFPKTTL